MRSTGPTLADVLRGRGYMTAGFTANLLYTSYESGLTHGFIYFQDYPTSITQLFLEVPLLQTGFARALIRARKLSKLRAAVEELDLSIGLFPGDEYVAAPQITKSFLDWQDRKDTRPFFAFLNYFDAHGPYRSPPEFQGRFGSHNPKRDRYDAAISYLDSTLDRLFTTLEERGVLQHTLVIVTSDHGDLFGEYGLEGHSNALYLPLVRVPLLLFYPPRVPGGIRVAQPVSLRDVPATILEIASGSPSTELSGTSLAGTWDSATPGEWISPAISQLIQGEDPNSKDHNARTWLESILDERYHYIRSGLGKEELYDWRADSHELANLAGSRDGIAVLPRLRALLQQQTGSRGKTVGK